MSGQTTKIEWQRADYGEVNFNAESGEVGVNDPQGMSGIHNSQSVVSGQTPPLDDIRRQLTDHEKRIKKLERDIRRLAKASNINGIYHTVLSTATALSPTNEWLSLPGMTKTLTPRHKSTLHITGVVRVSGSSFSTVASGYVEIRVVVNGTAENILARFAYDDNAVVIPGRNKSIDIAVPFTAIVDVKPKKSYTITVQAQNGGNNLSLTVQNGGTTRGDTYMVIEVHPVEKHTKVTTYKERRWILSANYDALNDRIVALLAVQKWASPYTGFPSSGATKTLYEVVSYEETELPVTNPDTKRGNLIYKWRDDASYQSFGRVAVRASDGMIFVEVWPGLESVISPGPYTRKRKLIDPAGFEEAEVVDEFTWDDYGNADGIYSQGLPVFYNGSVYAGGVWEDDFDGSKKFTLERLSDTDLSLTASDTIPTETGENNARNVLGFAQVGGLIRTWIVTSHGAAYKFRHADFDPATNTFGATTQSLSSESQVGIGWTNMSQIVPFNSLFALAIFRSATVYDIYEYTGGEATFGTLLVDNAAKVSGERMGIIATTDKLIFVQTSYLSANDQGDLEEVYAL